MKKAVVILLLLIYGSTTMGATVHLHYCMDEFVGWSLFHDEDNTCGKCGMEEDDKGSCCKDEHKHFKLKTDHKKSIASDLLTSIATPALVSPVSDFNIEAYPTDISEICTSSHAPPGTSRKRLHILYSIFLI